MKIKNVKKFVRSIFIIIALMFLIILLIEGASYSSKQVEYKTICISKGDTLWSIAKSNQKSNDYYKGKDIRFIIDDIMEINKLDNSSLKINQELIVPVI